MFRRCTTCAHLVCSKCFNRAGFKHKCTEGQALGPFPTYNQESKIMQLLDAKIPPRDASKPEKPYHNESWQWTPPPAILSQYPGVHMVGENLIGVVPGKNTALGISIPIINDSAIGHSESKKPTPPIREHSLTRVPNEQITGGADTETEKSLLYQIDTPESPAVAADGGQTQTTIFSSHEITDAEAEDEDEEESNFDSQEYQPSSPIQNEIEEEAYTPLRSKSLHSRRGSVSPCLEIDEDSDVEIATRSDPPLFSSYSRLTAPSEREVNEFKEVIKTKRTFDIDMGPLIRITMFPGFFLSDPNGEPGNILDNKGPIKLPLALGYQFRNSATDTLERRTIAVLQGRGDSVDAPAISMVASSHDVGQQGISRELQTLFERAIMGGSSFGDGSDINFPSMEH
ncbi:uncharacterized protein PV09_04533 [Verruconis gallopava]|uniref:Uncharacterized protein n=1 Tax=Verruconis gallopava TaxID=253628 RepID=A0A0D1YU68_9PEZI|nr:uncharacterized protein PV09_04533 [Verruconis gallopava]KIW04227.1 hypothetical protein PV09_04533 [Verruconis gallopava]